MIKKLAVYAVCILLVAALAFAEANYVVYTAGNRSIVDEASVKSTDRDAIIILGALVYGNGEPSWMLEDRLLTGLKLYKDGVAPKIIVTGDHGTRNYNEVRVMSNYLIERGVPREDIFLDHAGFDTYDSMYRARDIFKCKRPVVVTQKFHLSRAVFIAKGLGLDAQGVASDLRSYSGIKRNWIRELAARPKAFCDVLFKVKPKYLGKEIPISGSGLATDDGLS